MTQTTSASNTNTNTPAIGMMEGAFFVSKNALLKWVNKLLNTSVGKVEECANGAVYCRIIASLYPSKVSLKRVNNEAKLEYEFLNNYKILQKAFDDCGTKKHIEVDKLIRGKFQDNLEFLQWLRSFHDKISGNQEISQSADFTQKTPLRAEKKSPPRIADIQNPHRHEDWEIRRERDFFLNKLQHIEIVTNTALRDERHNPAAMHMVKQIQEILFNPEFI